MENHPLNQSLSQTQTPKKNEKRTEDTHNGSILIDIGIVEVGQSDRF
jgi:hypothetical protein